jgi:hypothetical protein
MQREQIQVALEALPKSTNMNSRLLAAFQYPVTKVLPRKNYHTKPFI